MPDPAKPIFQIPQPQAALLGPFAFRAISFSTAERKGRTVFLTYADGMAVAHKQFDFESEDEAQGALLRMVEMMNGR